MKHTPRSFAAFATVLALVGPAPRAVSGPCPDIIEGQEIVLRDSIGADNSSTNGNVPYQSYNNGGSNWSLVPFPITAPSNLELSTLRAIGCQISTAAVNFAAYDYRIRVFSSWAAFQASPTVGDRLNIQVDSPTQGPTAFGISGTIPGAGGTRTTYDFVFDLSAYDLDLSVGQSVWVAFQFFAIAGGGGTNWGILESTETGPSDILCTQSTYPTGCAAINTDVYSQHDGRVGVSLRAVAVSRRGDLSNNGSHGMEDVTPFVEALLDPAAWPINHPTVPLEAADMNCDSNVDGLDISGFVEKLLPP